MRSLVGIESDYGEKGEPLPKVGEVWGGGRKPWEGFEGRVHSASEGVRGGQPYCENISRGRITREMNEN